MGCFKKKDVEDTVLTFFMTGGVSLKAWEETGLLNRELELYKRLANKLQRINIVTYGGKEDRYICTDIKVLSTVWDRNYKKVAFSLLLKYMPHIYRTDIFKTNQIHGAEPAIWMKKILKKKLIIRCGYLPSYAMRQSGENKSVIDNIAILEKEAFSTADAVVVTTGWQKDIVVADYGIDRKKISVIPNYVITEIFKPYPDIKKEYDLIFIGRGREQKNIKNLLKALSYLKNKNRTISLLMVGQCSHEHSVRDMVRLNRLNVIFKDNIDNFKLPHLLNSARVYILPSLYECHPKSLLEAMSCGLACIGSNVEGIRTDIVHMQTGYLCGTDYRSIADAIELLLDDTYLQMKLGNNAREYVTEKYCIEKILQMELDLIEEMIHR